MAALVKTVIQKACYVDFAEKWLKQCSRVWIFLNGGRESFSWWVLFDPWENVVGLQCALFQNGGKLAYLGPPGISSGLGSIRNIATDRDDFHK